MLLLRKATLGDCDLIFSWANDEVVRENAFSKEPIEYSKHIEWFNKKINDDNVQIFIMSNDSIPVGQIRIDICDSIATISYSIASVSRGNGYGKKIIGLLEDEINEANKGIKIILAKVKFSNLASQRVFESNHYIRNDKEEYIEYLKELNN